MPAPAAQHYHSAILNRFQKTAPQTQFQLEPVQQAPAQLPTSVQSRVSNGSPRLIIERSEYSTATEMILIMTTHPNMSVTNGRVLQLVPKQEDTGVTMTETEEEKTGSEPEKETHRHLIHTSVGPKLHSRKPSNRSPSFPGSVSPC